LGDEEEEGKGGVFKTDFEESEAANAPTGVHLKLDCVVPAPSQLVSDPERSQQLKCPGLNRKRARLVGPIKLPVDDPKRGPERVKLGRQGQAGGPGTNDQNADLLIVPGRHQLLAD
jgi:hypothetical protein